MGSGIKISNIDFCERFKKIHPELEMITKYVNMKTFIKVKDSLGIIYIQRPQDILLGKKPTIQSAENKTFAFVVKSKYIHGDIYDYASSEYINARTKLIVKCEFHGCFYITPECHLSRRQGCPECGKKSSVKNRKNIGVGWSLSSWEKQALKSKLFSGYKLYILKCHNENEMFLKIGRTYMNIRKRFEDKNKMPYQYSLLFVKKGGAKEIFDLENSLQKIFEKKYKPKISFAGCGECFELTLKNKVNILNLKSKIKSNKELHFNYSVLEQERLDNSNISGGLDLELQKFN